MLLSLDADLARSVLPGERVIAGTQGSLSVDPYIEQAADLSTVRPQLRVGLTRHPFDCHPGFGGMAALAERLQVVGVVDLLFGYALAPDVIDLCSFGATEPASATVALKDRGALHLREPSLGLRVPIAVQHRAAHRDCLLDVGPEYTPITPSGALVADVLGELLAPLGAEQEKSGACRKL